MISDPHLADSSGVPWQGRRFEETVFAGDDGSAPPRLLAAIESFRAGDADAAEVVDAIRDSRLLIPLVATLGGSEAGPPEAGGHEHDGSAVGPHGLVVDKSADLAIVTVAGPDGRAVMPVFTSVAAMSSWNTDARPVPTAAVRVALAAAAEDTDLVVLDPTSPTEFVIRRPALWAIARSEPWVPGDRSPAVAAAVASSLEGERSVVAHRLGPGDPSARLTGPEVVVRLTLRPRLDDDGLRAMLARVQRSWAESPIIAAQVDSLAVILERAEG